MSYKIISANNNSACWFNENGMPMGIQIIAKKFDDLKLLAFAKRYEEIFNYSKLKPKFSN